MEISRTAEFDDWINGLRDRLARAIILRRLERLGEGQPGDVRPVGRGVSEMRIHAGPGYRVYLAQRGGRLVILLCGGDKDSQPRDIARAKALAADWRG